MAKQRTYEPGTVWHLCQWCRQSISTSFNVSVSGMFLLPKQAGQISSSSAGRSSLFSPDCQILCIVSRCLCISSDLTQTKAPKNKVLLEQSRSCSSSKQPDWLSHFHCLGQKEGIYPALQCVLHTLGFPGHPGGQWVSSATTLSLSSAVNFRLDPDHAGHFTEGKLFRDSLAPIQVETRGMTTLPKRNKGNWHHKPH